MGEVTGERRYWEGALAILKSLEARGALLAMDQPMIAALETFLGRPATEQKQRR